MARFHALVAVALVLPSPGCFPTKISGAQAPTEHTFRLTARDVDIAVSWGQRCAQDWVTGDSTKDVETALGLLERRGVRVKVGNPVAGGTALRRTLLVSKDFETSSAASKARLLSHELVHYCERDLLGHKAFEELYAHSAGRWRIETPAHLQQFATLALQGATQPALAEAIEARLPTMRDSYWLHDIDPEQYAAETRAIWLSVIDD